MTRFTKAKRASLRKWRGILGSIKAKMSWSEYNSVWSSRCGFCHAYKGSGMDGCTSGRCPALLAPCQSDEWAKHEERIDRAAQWRKPAAEFCEWVIAEVSKLKDPEAQ